MAMRAWDDVDDIVALRGLLHDKENQVLKLKTENKALKKRLRDEEEVGSPRPDRAHLFWTSACAECMATPAPAGGAGPGPCRPGGAGRQVARRLV